MIKLSIIIPVYNVEKYIRICLESILNKKTKGLPFEVIVVDDGTPDKSMEIVKELAKEYENLTVLHQHNQGQGEARNNGINAAKGEYIWFVDSDDWIEENAITTLLDMIDSSNAVDMYAIPFYWYYADGKSSVDIKINENLVMSGVNFLQKGFIVAACRFVFKKKLMTENSLYFNKGILHEDGIWGFEMLYLAKKVALLCTPLYYYRQRSDSDMHKRTIKSGYDIIKIHKLLNIFMQQHVLPSDRTWFQKWNMLRLEEAVNMVWHLRKTKKFEKFLQDTKVYRCQVCDECMSLGGIKWKLKCWMFKYPVLNKKRRLVLDYIKSILK